MRKAQIFHASVIKKGLENSVYKCNLLLQAYTKSHDALSEANKLLHFMHNPNVVSHNTLLSAYFNSGLVSQALHTFSTIPLKDSHSWNIAISGCVKNHKVEEAMTHFFKMRSNTVIRPDNFTYSIILPSCDLAFGYQIHAEIIKLCSISDLCLWTSLMQMYACFGVVGDAMKVFNEMPSKDLVTCNALMSSYSRRGLGDLCLNLYKQFWGEGIFADEYTYSIVLNELVSRLQVKEAMQVHLNVVKLGFCYDEFISNSLLELYAKSGLVDCALALFEQIPHKDVFSWTTIVTGLSQSGHTEDAMWLFHEMQLADMEPSSFTFGGLLGACAATNRLQRGKQLHGLVVKYGFENDLVVATAILDMYFKCGEMEYAFMMFQSMPKSERDIVVWNGTICGYAQNGEAKKALKLYDEMMQLGPSVISPNDATFTGVLSACSHSGLVKEGCNYFNDMINKHMINPKIEHYTCMVDMLGRAGLLEEAEALLLQMPWEPDDVMWSTLLGVCNLHCNLTMAMRISEHLHSNGPRNSSNYVLLANSHAHFGDWSETVEVREMMNLRGLKKSSGCSWVEVGGYLHSFLAGDKSHPQIERVYQVLKSICIHMLGRCEKVLNFASD